MQGHTRNERVQAIHAYEFLSERIGDVVIVDPASRDPTYQLILRNASDELVQFLTN
jgi:hypothetical protein